MNSLDKFLYGKKFGRGMHRIVYRSIELGDKLENVHFVKKGIIVFNKEMGVGTE